MAIRIGRDVDIEGYDAACVDDFLIDGFACLVSNPYLIGIANWIKIDT